MDRYDDDRRERRLLLRFRRSRQLLRHFHPPAGYGFTIPNAGSDQTIDSNATATGTTASFSVGSGQEVTIDAGLVSVPPGTVRGRVWQDGNENGIQDAAEQDVSDVPVYLYDTVGFLIDVTTTGSDGRYEFANVKPGTYRVAFDAPAGSIGTLRDQGGDDTIDSDGDSFGRTSPFSVSSGAIVSSVDFGLRPFRSLTVTGSDAGQQPLVKVFDATTDQELYGSSGECAFCC